MSCTQRLVLATVVLACRQTARAQNNTNNNTNSWYSRWKLDYHRNHCWPEPFIPGDRASVNMPFVIMADNGWKRQNLLTHYHFVDGGTKLNQAGQ